jgi:hypothetical protein
MFLSARPPPPRIETGFIHKKMSTTINTTSTTTIITSNPGACTRLEVFMEAHIYCSPSGNSHHVKIVTLLTGIALLVNTPLTTALQTALILTVNWSLVPLRICTSSHQHENTDTFTARHVPAAMQDTVFQQLMCKCYLLVVHLFQPSMAEQLCCYLKLGACHVIYLTVRNTSNSFIS